MNILNKFKKNTFITNSIVAVGGEGLSSVFQIISLSLLTLSLKGFYSGMFLMILSYNEIFFTIFSFQSYNAIVSFVGREINSKNYEKVKIYLKQAVIQDFLASTLGTIVALALIIPISNFMNWNKEMLPLLSVYTFFMFLNNKGVFIGILRLFGNFKDVALSSVLANAFKLCWFLLGLLLNKNIAFFLLGELLCLLIQLIILLISSYKVLKKNNLHNFLNCKLIFNKEFVIFNIHNNLTSTADIPVNQLSVFVINKFLGLDEVPVFKIIQKLAGILQKIVLPIREVLFPKISMLSTPDTLHKIFKINLKYALVNLLIGGITIISIVLTKDTFLSKLIEPTTYNMAALIIYLSLSTLTSSLSIIHLLFMTFNLVRYNLPIIIISNTIYLLLLVMLGNKLSLITLILLMSCQWITVISAKYIVFYNTVWKKKFSTSTKPLFKN